MNKALGVSAIVCCHDSAEVIGESIAALASQRVPAGIGFEVILVDNNCRDDTVARAHAIWSQTPHPLRVIRETEPGLIYARRAGHDAARHDIVLYVDDDNVLAPDWVEKLPAIFSAHPRVAAVGGFNEPLIEGESPAWFFKPFSGVYACHTQPPPSGVLAKGDTLYGAGLALRMEASQQIFHQPPPFFLTGRTGSELLRGEDSEMCLRAVLRGWDLWREESLRLRHRIMPRRLTWEYVLEARRNGGRADSRLLVYRELAEGREPLPFHQRCGQAAEWWQAFWRSCPSVAELPTAGSRKSFRHSYLQGMTEGLLALGEDAYMEMRSLLMTQYGTRR